MKDRELVVENDMQGPLKDDGEFYFNSIDLEPLSIDSRLSLLVAVDPAYPKKYTGFLLRASDENLLPESIDPDKFDNLKDYVTAIQNYINDQDLGSFLGEMGADGLFGPKTYNALKKSFGLNGSKPSVKYEEFAEKGADEINKVRDGLLTKLDDKLRLSGKINDLLGFEPTWISMLTTYKEEFTQSKGWDDSKLEDLFVLVNNVENLLDELDGKQNLITLLNDFSKRFEDKLSDKDFSNVFIDAQMAISGINNQDFLLKSENAIRDLLKKSNENYAQMELANLHIGGISSRDDKKFNFIVEKKVVRANGIALIFDVNSGSRKITVEVANDYKSISCLGEKANFDVNRNCVPDLKAFLVSKILPKLGDGKLPNPPPALSRSGGAVPLSGAGA